MLGAWHGCHLLVFGCGLAPVGDLRGRRLTAADRLPIRITFDTTSVTDTAQATLLTTPQRALIVGNVLPDAQAVIQNLLSVNRVVGNLTASRQCTSVFTSNGELRCAAFRSVPFRSKQALPPWLGVCSLRAPQGHPPPCPTSVGTYTCSRASHVWMRCRVPHSRARPVYFCCLLPSTRRTAGVCAAYKQTLPLCGSSFNVTLPQAVVGSAYYGCTDPNNVRVCASVVCAYL